MSHAKIRYGGATLAGAIAIACLINQGAAIADPQAKASRVHTGVQEVGNAGSTGGPLKLSVLSLPDFAATAASGGYAGQDVLIDVNLDLPDRDETFVIQRQDGDAWADAATGTTSGPGDTGSISALPAGTYRVVLPAQFGLSEYVSEPFAHTPKQLSASLTQQGDTIALAIDPAYSFTWQRQSGSDWQNVSVKGTKLVDPKPGTYRAVVPDQADSLGAVSNTLTVAEPARVVAPVSRVATNAIPTSTTTEAVADFSGGGIVGTAMAQLGDGYVHAGNGPSVFDCSGLTSYVYRTNGISIPRTAGAQYAAARKVNDPQPGDLVFFLNGAEHVGIYLGNGRIVHAANARTGVIVSNINSGWYARTFTGFGRY